VLAGSLAPAERGEVAVVFSPATSEAAAWAIIRAAGGQLVAPTRLGNIVVAYAPDPDFQQRARDLGALFFLKAGGLCAPLTDQAS